MADPIVLPDGRLTDGVIALRPWTAGDVNAIYEACQDPEIQRFTRVPSPYERTDAERLVTLCGDGLREGTAAHLCIASAGGGEVLGAAGLVALERNSSAEIGYWVAREARGRGIAKRAVRIVCAWAFEDLGCKRVQAETRPENAASRRVLERCGFTFEGILRSYAVLRGERIDSAMYSLLPGELR